jgi:hypothetical protein
MAAVTDATVYAVADAMPPWTTFLVPPPHPRALPHAPPNNMLIVTSLFKPEATALLPQQRQASLPTPTTALTPTDSRSPPPSCPDNAAAAPTKKRHNRRHRQPSPSPMPRRLQHAHRPPTALTMLPCSSCPAVAPTTNNAVARQPLPRPLSLRSATVATAS